MRIRQGFATPFVLVMGCSSGSSHDRSTAAPPSPPPIVAVVADAGSEAPPERQSPPPDAPLDADVPDPNRPAKLDTDPCKLPPRPGNPTCNPPAPTTSTGPVLSSKRSGDDLIIDAGRGLRDGVDKRWRLELVTDGGKSVPNGGLEILRVEPAHTSIRIKGIRSLPNPAAVRFSPP